MENNNDKQDKYYVNLTWRTEYLYKILAAVFNRWRITALLFKTKYYQRVIFWY